MTDKENTGPELCPMCGDKYADTLDDGEQYWTPGQIDDWWQLCVSDGTVYVHDSGVHNYNEISPK